MKWKLRVEHTSHEARLWHCVSLLVLLKEGKEALDLCPAVHKKQIWLNLIHFAMIIIRNSSTIST